MDILTLFPFRALGFFCLLIGLGPMPTLFAGLGNSSAILSTALAMTGICLLWIRPALFNPTGPYRVFRKTLSIVRSVMIFGGCAFVVSGYMGGSIIGIQMHQAAMRLQYGQWWTTAIALTVVALVIDLGLGMLQILVPRLNSN